MKGYWHINAISVTFAFLNIYFGNDIFAIGLLLWLLCLFYFKRLGKLPFFVSLVFFLFFSFYIPPIKDDPIRFSSEQLHISGQITGSVKITDKVIEFPVKEKQTKETYHVLYFKDETTHFGSEEKLLHGATCEIIGTIQIPDPSRNPGQFNYQRYLAEKGISYQLVIDSLTNIHCEGSSVIANLFMLREKLQTYVNNRYSMETAAWINALVLGNDDDLPEETIELYRRWSLSHLLAISGLHVGLVVMLIYFLLIKSGLVTKETAQWLLIFFLPVYAFIAGGEPSVWRASMMTFLFLLITKSTIRYSASDIISIVFLAIILVDKYIIYHIGFQFSFLVSFGLILSSKWLSETNSFLFQMLQVSFISQMIILPLQFSAFYSIQPLSILLNVLVVPYYSFFVIPFMFILLIIGPIPLVPIVFDHCFMLIQQLYELVIRRIDHLLDFPFLGGDIPLYITIFYYGLLLIFMILISNKKLIHAFLMGLLVTSCVITIVLKPYVSANGSVTMLDIGQGDAFIIELPYRKGVIFIDAGATLSFADMEPSDKVYRQILQPYLRFKGISKIDAIFLSHEDIDHVGSVPFLVEDFNVAQIFISNEFELSDEMTTVLSKHDTKLSRVSRHDGVTIKGQLFSILSPQHDNDSANENSLVIHTNLGGLNWLFTGDIGEKTENELISEYSTIPVDVLKVGHHGSNTSTSVNFIEKINPQFGLISAGVNNRYNHPSNDVLETLTNAGVTILRTDQDGAVVYHFKEGEGTFYRFLSYDGDEN